MKLKIGYFSCSVVVFHFLISYAVIMSDSLKQYIRERRLNYYSKEHKKQRDGLRSRLDATHAARWACILNYQRE